MDIVLLLIIPHYNNIYVKILKAISFQYENNENS